MPDLTQNTGQLVCYDSTGAPLQGVTFTFAIFDVNGSAGESISTTPIVGSTNSGGTLSQALIVGEEYVLYLGSANKLVNGSLFTVPSSPNPFPLPFVSQNTSSAAILSGQYCTSNDLIEVCGAANLQAYSDLNNTGQTDWGRVAYWMNVTASRIVRIFATDGNATTPVNFTQFSVYEAAAWNAKLAVAELYFTRGVMRDESTDTKMKALVEEVMKEMREARNEEPASFTKRWAQSTAPQGYAAGGVGGMPTGGLYGAGEYNLP